MNRRQFTAGLGAVAAAPALPLKAATSVVASPGAIPNPARFWAIYMSQLHGKCTPETLVKMTGIKANAARTYLSQMVAEGTITPMNIIDQVIKTKTPNANAPKSRLQEFIDQKSKALIEDDDEDIVETEQLDETDDQTDEQA